MRNYNNNKYIELFIIMCLCSKCISLQRIFTLFQLRMRSSISSSSTNNDSSSVKYAFCN